MAYSLDFVIFVSSPTKSSRCRYLWYSCRDSGFATVPLGFKVDPETICLTAISIFFPFTVYYKICALSRNKSRNWKTYWDICDLKNICRYVSCTQVVAYGATYAID